MRVSADSLSLRELLAIVESGVFYWRQRLAESDGVARSQAAAALQDLSRILDSLAQQLVAGRETVRITSRLPSTRNAPRACAACGRGNRSSAKFCIACGAALRPGSDAAPPPPPTFRLNIAARSDVGMVRKINEDTYYTGEFTTADGSIGTLLLVADGMGGHQSGEVASQLAAKTVKTVLGQGLSQEVPQDDAGWHTLLRQAVLNANERIYQQSRSQDGRRMGTTLTVALITERRAHIAHVGDSRAYLINAAGVGSEQGTWVQLTSDHSLVARLVDIGQLTPEQARQHPQRNMIYRSLGTDAHVEVDLLSQALAPGDTLLLCSDGLDTHVEDAEIAQIVLKEQSENRACEHLIALAKQRGGKDNISVVIARVRA
ncbi:protein phosphatase 2C-like protein [Oscillochloris trichoides DG-6]|uniref:Protein phosphatase 2C-like protein n=1 Tax=Oscillochloris trichoides DG-6 TaxID=765420 RepID=E1IH74_9CHLR|nr:protein phosphatase 2C-like protein [Oscillochloris trichoides DG-6]